VAIATPESYADMLDRAKAGKYAIPAINVTSSQTLSAALKGFADAESDGIVQISNGGAAYWSGSSRLDRVKGSIAFAAYARAVGDLYPVTIGLHTDHCPKKLLADWIHPLLEIEAEQVKNGELPMFNSHMWDGSAEALDDNIEIAVDMLKRSKAANVVLEIEIGAVGGEEDGIKGEENANLYTTADDAWKAVEALGLGENGRYITALTFGNVHGSYKPGHVKLRPEILGEIQEDVAKRLGDRLSSKVGDKSSPFDLVMHGGSGSTDEEIATAVRNGVIKMNVDTDTQYAFTRPVAGWMYTNYEGVLKVDGEVGNKKQYDPRAWGKAAEEGMAARVVEAGGDLDDDLLLASRTVPASGRSRAYLGGRSVPASVLSEVGGRLVSVHGQADQLRLRSTAAQRAALDSLGGQDHAALCRRYAKAYQARRRADQELQEWQASAQARAVEVAQLRTWLEALEEIAPRSGEDRELTAEAERLDHAEDLRRAATARTTAPVVGGGSTRIASGRGAVSSLRARGRSKDR